MRLRGRIALLLSAVAACLLLPLLVSITDEAPASAPDTGRDDDDAILANALSATPAPAADVDREPVERTNTLLGRVVDTDGEPVRDAVVRFSTPAGGQVGSVELDADGSFRMSRPTSTATVDVTLVRRLRSLHPYVDWRPRSIDLATARELTIVATPPPSISGRLLDEFGSGLPGVRVRTDRVGTTTDGDGRFELPPTAGQPLSAPVRLHLGSPGLRVADARPDEPNFLPSPVAWGTRDLTVRVQRGATLTVRVTRPPEPLATQRGFDVFVGDDPGRLREIASASRFSRRGEVDGVVVHGFGSRTPQFVRIVPQDPRLRIPPARAVHLQPGEFAIETFALEAAPALAIEVLDGESPVENALVRAVEGAVPVGEADAIARLAELRALDPAVPVEISRATTDAAGTATLHERGLSERMAVYVSARGYEPAIAHPEPGARSLRVVLGKSGAVVGTLTDAGTPGRLGVALRSVADPTRFVPHANGVTPMGRGQFEITGVPRGAWELVLVQDGQVLATLETLQVEGGRTERTAYSVTEWRPVDVTLRLSRTPPRDTILRLVRSDFAPPPAEVGWRRPSDGRVETSLAPGRYRIEWFPPLDATTELLVGSTPLVADIELR